MQKHLYKITERIEALEELLETVEGKDTEADVKDALTTVYGDVSEAVYDGIGYIERLKNLSEGMKAEEERIKNARKAVDTRIERLKTGYAEFLQALGKKKIETMRGTMTVSAPTFRTKVYSMYELPDVYKRTTTRIDPDLVAIKQAIQGGHKVPGAQLEETHSIRIK